MKTVSSVVRRKRLKAIQIGLLTLWAGVFALLFLMPTVLTFTNSFMSAGEISASYGSVFSSDTGTSYIAERVKLKYIPDMVTFKQYSSFLFESPDYLYKFWNSVFLVLPIVLFQVAIAALAAYGFARYRGRGRELLFFAYIVLMLMPSQVTLVPNYLVAKYLNILDTRWAIVLPGIFTPFSVFILTKTHASYSKRNAGGRVSGRGGGVADLHAGVSASMPERDLLGDHSGVYRLLEHG